MNELRRAELRERMKEIREELDAFEAEDTAEECAALLGRHFKTQNCYSCPEKPSDYWRLYVKPLRIDKDGTLIAVSFQIDRDGKIDIENKQYFYPKQLASFQEITEKAFNKARDLCLKAATKALSA